MKAFLVLALTSIGCQSPESDSPPAPDYADITLRYTADAYMQSCRWSGNDWNGVAALSVTLEHRLSGVSARGLPAPGTCVSGLALYAEESLPSGDDFSASDTTPRYETPEFEGPITRIVPGLWHDSPFPSGERCGKLNASVGAGIGLIDTGDYPALSTPPPGDWESASFDGVPFDDATPLVFGQTGEIAWDASGWSGGFIQIQQRFAGEVRDTVTCTPVGSSFTLDEEVWSVANDKILADSIVLYVVMTNADIVADVTEKRDALVETRAIFPLQP